MDFKPIGHIESGFKFKNGTPRQPTVCGSARARLTINTDTYSNPEHSVEGLEQFSHVWVIFVFHQNNNPYTKAKVKPPRLNGAKVGVFSTRSPYRLNPVGLTLAKIESVEGATVHLSGVDMLDGTPVLDIKPYIPLYDQPHMMMPSGGEPDSPPEGPEQECDENYVQAEDLVLPHHDIELPDPPEANPCQKQDDDKVILGIDVCQRSTECNTSEGDCTNDSDRDTLAIEPNEVKDISHDSAVEDDVPKVNNYSSQDKEQPTATRNQTTKYIGSVTHNTSQEGGEGGSQGQVEFAEWIKTPPYQKLTVRWTPTAEAQLQQFSKEAQDDRYRLEFIKSTDEARKAVHDILHADPRSSYRRKKCVDRLYFFMVDVLHVTCWFNDDESVAEVVRIKPNREKMLQKLAGFK